MAIDWCHYRLSYPVLVQLWMKYTGEYMPRYVKYCPICGTEFLADRIGATYCSKKCRSKAGRFNNEMLDILIKGAASRTKILNTMPKAVRDYIQHEKEMATHLSNGDINNKDLIPVQEELTKVLAGSVFLSKADKAVIVQEAMKLKRDREKEILDEKLKDVVMPLDNEMANFRLPDKKENKKEENNNDDNLPTLDIGE